MRPDMVVGKRFGAWTIIDLPDDAHPGKVCCRCECGTVRWIMPSLLRCGKTKSCGCKAHATKDYGVRPGDRIGQWTILEQNQSRFHCRCDCGTERWIQATILLRGRSRSCGCCRQEKRPDAYRKELQKGHVIMGEIHQKKLSPKYNGFGRKTNKNSSTGVTGVSLMKGRWYRAYINIGRKQIHLGNFDTLEEAAAARKAAEKKYFAPRQAEVDAIVRKASGKKKI